MLCINDHWKYTTTMKLTTVLYVIDCSRYNYVITNYTTLQYRSKQAV